MKISKKDALTWFEFFASLPEDEEIMTRQQEIVYAVFAQIEAAVDSRHQRLMAQIPHLKTVENRSFYVGSEGKFPKGCRSCLFGTGLSAIGSREPNRFYPGMGTLFLRMMGEALATALQRFDR